MVGATPQSNNYGSHVSLQRHTHCASILYLASSLPSPSRFGIARNYALHLIPLVVYTLSTTFLHKSKSRRLQGGCHKDSEKVYYPINSPGRKEAGRPRLQQRVHRHQVIAFEVVVLNLLDEHDHNYAYGRILLAKEFVTELGFRPSRRAAIEYRFNLLNNTTRVFGGPDRLKA